VGENSPPEDEERWTDGSEASNEAVEAGKSRKRKHNRVSDSNPFGTEDNTSSDSAANYKKSRCDNSLDAFTPSTAQTHNAISGTFLGQHFDPDYHEIKPDDEDDNGDSVSKSIEAQIPLKTFKCNVKGCQRSYAHRRSLDKHLGSDHNPALICEECSFGANNEYNFRRHNCQRHLCKLHKQGKIPKLPYTGPNSTPPQTKSSKLHVAKLQASCPASCPASVVCD